MSDGQLPPPPAALDALPEHWVEWSSDVWRVHQNSSDRPAWNELRFFGPVPSMRFDPHEPPIGPSKPEGVQYVGSSALVAFAEAFQATRLIPVHDPSLILVKWAPQRPLRLLDVRRDFGVRNGATASFGSWHDKTRVQEWARAVHRAWPDCDGILYPAKVTGWDTLVLFTHAAHDPVWPRHPSFGGTLSDTSLLPFIVAVAQKLKSEIDYGPFLPT